VRFEDIDAAGIVFFARFLNYAHDAMERLFDELPGGYAALIMKRGVGFPAVHATTDFKAPIRYGDTARITASVKKLGTTSCHFEFSFTRASDGETIATASHVHVCTSLSTMTKLPLPADVRSALEKHLVA
jgi:4-hydroxybenzoyl-CoA thioesterase